MGERTTPPSSKRRGALPLNALAAAARELPGVRRAELSPGDRVVVSTRNSIYSLVACADGEFEVAGGWYARQGACRRKLAVNGCTAGGHALLTELVAAPGLFLEFADGTKTTRIRRVRTLRAAPTAA